MLYLISEMILIPSDIRYRYATYKTHTNSHLLYLNYMASLYKHTYSMNRIPGNLDVDSLLGRIFPAAVVRDVIEMLSDYCYLDDNYEGYAFKYTDKDAVELWEKLPFEKTAKMRDISLHMKNPVITLPDLTRTKFVSHDGVWDGARFYTWFDFYYLNGVSHS